MKRDGLPCLALRLLALSACTLALIAPQCRSRNANNSVLGSQNTSQGNAEVASTPFSNSTGGVSMPGYNSQPEQPRQPQVETKPPVEVGEPEEDITDPNKAVEVIQRMAEQAQANEKPDQVVMAAQDLSNTRWSIFTTINNAPEQFGSLSILKGAPQPGTGGFVRANYTTTHGTVADMYGTFNGAFIMLAHSGPGGYFILKGRIDPNRPSEIRGSMTTVVTSGGGDKTLYQITAYRE